MADRIDTKTSRAKLAPRREPYWHQLRPGGHIGFRQLTQGEGTWTAKWRDAATGKRSKQSFGALPDTGKPSAFDVARQRANEWFDALERGGVAEVVTVGEACAAYAKALPAGPKQKRALADFRRLIDSDQLASIELRKLQPRHVEDWRKRTAAQPARIGRGTKTKGRPKSPATLNRDLAALRAALNKAHDRREVDSDMAWRVALRPEKGAQRRREVDLGTEDRRRLVEAASGPIRPFLQALATLPVRPGALAALVVGDWDARQHTLHIRKDKAGAGRRIALPESTAKLFTEQCANKLPAAPIFQTETGGHWTKDTWKKAIAPAVAAAALPPTVTAYVLRHSVLTDMVTAGHDLATIAKLAGTSVAMLEAVYHHLRAEHAREALAGLTL